MTADADQIATALGGGTEQSLRSVVLEAVSHASWLTAADAAAVQLALRLADRLDAMPLEAGTRDVEPLSRELRNVLTDLGMTVKGRTGKAEPEKEVSPLDAFRNAGPARITDPKAGKPAKS